VHFDIQALTVQNTRELTGAFLYQDGDAPVVTLTAVLSAVVVTRRTCASSSDHPYIQQTQSTFLFFQRRPMLAGESLQCCGCTNSDQCICHL